MGKISNFDIVKNDKKIGNFPVVVVDQTNVRISDIIKRNLAGEQVMGTNKLAFDYMGTEEFTSMKVNPFNTIGFDLDDLIQVASENGLTISDLRDKKGRLDKALLEAKAKAKQAKEVDSVKQVDKIEDSAKNDGANA